jgi:hypothetical protein
MAHPGYINTSVIAPIIRRGQEPDKELKAGLLCYFKQFCNAYWSSGIKARWHLYFLRWTKIVNLEGLAHSSLVIVVGVMQDCCVVIISNKLHRLCWKCNVRGDESGKPLVKCKKINMLRMMQLVKDNRQDILKISTSTMCIMRGLMSVMVAVDLVYSVPRVPLSCCIQLKKWNSSWLSFPSCSWQTS